MTFRIILENWNGTLEHRPIFSWLLWRKEFSEILCLTLWLTSFFLIFGTWVGALFPLLNVVGWAGARPLASFPEPHPSLSQSMDADAEIMPRTVLVKHTMQCWHHLLKSKRIHPEGSRGRFPWFCADSRTRRLARCEVTLNSSLLLLYFVPTIRQRWGPTELIWSSPSPNQFKTKFPADMVARATINFRVKDNSV